MKKYQLTLFGFIFLFACQDVSEKKSEVMQNDTVSNTTDTTGKPSVLLPKKENKLEKVKFDFLSDCDSLQMWNGGIQGVPFSDSTSPYIMAQCFSNKHYDLIVYSDREIELEEGADYKRKRIVRGIKDAEYYAFEIPKKVPDNPENDLDTYDYVYPSQVKIYKLFDDGWYLIKKENVNSFEELGRVKLNAIYKK